VKPKLHLFGHIHETYGIDSNKDTVFMNGATLDEKYKVKNKPWMF